MFVGLSVDLLVKLSHTILQARVFASLTLLFAPFQSPPFAFSLFLEKTFYRKLNLTEKGILQGDEKRSIKSNGISIDFAFRCKKENRRGTGRPRAIRGQRYPLPCFAWL